MPHPERQAYGLHVEQEVARHLQSKGLTFVEANYRCKMGEIDLIMRDNETLVFVEVRFRSDANAVNPLESITRSKQRKVIRTASYYLLDRHNSHDLSCRFDAVGVTRTNDCWDFDWVSNAFY